MFNYSKRNLIIISVSISLVILLSLNFILKIFKENQFVIQNQDKKENLNLKTSQIKSNENEKINIENNEVFNKEGIVENQYKNNDWRVLIPKINLDAPILEGTSQSNLRRGVGHFEDSAMWDGNVCLAAHNRGYKYNFFQDIKSLEIGDIIEYKNNNDVRDYSVIWKGKIEETDFSYLEDTEENKITLLTCVESMPEYRLCIQACERKT